MISNGARGDALDETEVAFAGVAGQAALLARRALSSPELVDLCLARIARLDGRLRAFVSVFTDAARDEASRAQQARDAGDRRPLLGVPIAVKDNTAVAGHAAGMGTGSPELPARDDAEVVRRLRAAGMVVVGTTALPELALWPFTESVTTGATRNPWDPARSPGGSSGGSAAAVAAGLVPAATASDGGGSIRIPAACCGLVGLKPQRDRVSLAPATSHWRGLSHLGFLTRSVRDTALLLDATATPRDPAATTGPGSRAWPRPLVDALDTSPGTLRVAWTDRASVPTRLDPLVREALESTLRLLRDGGHQVSRRDVPYGELQHVFVPRYLRGAADDARSLVEREALERRTRTVARLGRLVPERVVARAMRDGEHAERRLAAFFDDVDVLVTPLLTSPPLPVGRFAGRGALATLMGSAQYMPFAPPWNVTGQPAMAVPAGNAPDGVPLAVQLVARPGGEPVLLALAAQLEAARGWLADRPALAT